MKFCTEHWEALRTAIDARGMGELVARSGEEAVEYLKREVEGEATVFDFDPLMGCHNTLTHVALQLAGIKMMYADENGEQVCPVCALKAIDWINDAADGALYEARKRGIVEGIGN